MHQHQNLDSEVLFLVFFLVKLVGATQFGPVEILNLTRTTQGRIGLLIKEGDNQRIYVEDVVPEEPAATQGGLRQGDRILEARDIFFIAMILLLYLVARSSFVPCFTHCLQCCEMT